jgi:hypothetical protein
LRISAVCVCAILDARVDLDRPCRGDTIPPPSTPQMMGSETTGVSSAHHRLAESDVSFISRVVDGLFSSRSTPTPTLMVGYKLFSNPTPCLGR